MGVEAVGDDVTRPNQVKHLLQRGGRHRHVHGDGHLRGVGHASRRLERRQRPLARHRRGGERLDPLDRRAVLGNRADGVGLVDVAPVAFHIVRVMNGDGAQRGDVDKGVEPRHRPSEHPLTIPGKSEGAGAAHVHGGGDSSRRADGVRVHHLVVQFKPQVRVQVHQARRHQPAGSIEHLSRSLGRQAGRNGHDAAVTHGDVGAAPEAARGVQHLTPANQQINVRQEAPPLV